MNKLLTSIAYSEFYNKNYIKSLELYSILSKKIDEDVYRLNIELCRKKINNQKPHFYSILDTISNKCWKDNFMLFPIYKEDYIKKITSTNFPLFIESCWHGNNDNWLYAFTSPGLKHINAQKLIDALKFAKKIIVR